MLKLFIETENAAFEDEPATEIARILRDAASRIENSAPRYMTMRDINGNRVGECEITNDD